MFGTVSGFRGKLFKPLLYPLLNILSRLWQFLIKFFGCGIATASNLKVPGVRIGPFFAQFLVGTSIIKTIVIFVFIIIWEVGAG